MIVYRRVLMSPAFVLCAVRKLAIFKNLTISRSTTMGSLQQVQFEFPVAFLEALVTAPFNTNIMLMDAQFENKDECNFLGWKSEEIVTLVLEGKETGLNIQTIDNALCFRVLSGAGEERAPPEEELKEEPMQEDVEEPMLEEVEQEPEAPVTAETYEIVLEQPMPTQELQEGEIHAITEDSIITAAEMTNDSPYSKVLYMCPDDGCILEFADIGGLMKHINSDRHRNQSNHPFLTEIVKQMEKSVVSDTEILRITCPLCQAQVGPKTAFRHIGDEHSDHPQYEFAVSYCKDTIRQHRKNRDLERTPGGKLCPHCGKQYNGLKNWRRHVKHWCSQNPSRVQVFLCTKCSFQSVDPQKFEAHQSRHLEDRDSHVCTLCQKPFKSEYGLGTHMSLMHGDQVKVLPYKCRECSHSCETEEEHKEHMLTHKAKRFKCELCTAVYKNLTTLRHHIKQYHAGEFPLHCEKCGSGIANHEAVPLHRCSTKSMGGEVDNAMKHQCPHCSFFFKNVKVLANHIRYIHNDNFPYRCNYCGHGIRTKSALARHKCSSARHRHGTPLVKEENFEEESPKRRGRPKKNPPKRVVIPKSEELGEEDEGLDEEGEVEHTKEELAPRKRGRPRKTSYQIQEEVDEDSKEEGEVTPRKRGRPRKNIPEVVDQDPAEDGEGQ